MSDKGQAISITTDVTIDWAELGRVFADELSPAQAEFFMGFYEAVIDGQLAYIGAEKIFDGEREYVANLLQDLADHVRARS